MFGGVVVLFAVFFPLGESLREARTLKADSLTLRVGISAFRTSVYRLHVFH